LRENQRETTREKERERERKEEVRGKPVFLEFNQPNP
jgi:hypothetical protein